MTVTSLIKRALSAARGRTNTLSQRESAASGPAPQVIQSLDEVPTGTLAEALAAPAPQVIQSLDEVPTGTLAEALAARIAGEPGNPQHEVFYRRGFHLLRKHFYLPIPDDTDELDEFWEARSDLAGLDMNDAGALELMERILPPYLEEFRAQFPLDQREGANGFFLINGGYMAVDAHVYYGLIRHFRPRRIVEIGCGNSTLLATAAMQRNIDEGGAPTHLTVIDPYPWDIFKAGFPGVNELLVEKVQRVPLSLFAGLESGDLLFIDSSHVIRSGNDVHFEFLEILPRLKPGVLVHVHDVSLPKPYPRVYYQNQLYWNEQYLLQAFLAFNRRFEVLWPGNYMLLTYPERTLKAFPEMALMRERYPSSEPTAFWMRVTDAAT